LRGEAPVNLTRISNPYYEHATLNLGISLIACIMKISALLRRTQRKGITPIIATVLIIAVTLIAAVAIAGFVFGIFGSAASTANVAAISATAAHGAAGTLTAVCAAETTVPYVNIGLSNSGTAGTTATSITLTTGGSTVSTTLPTACTIGASGSATATITVGIELGVATVAGQQFNGYVSLANGAEVLFTGTFT